MYQDLATEKNALDAMASTDDPINPLYDFLFDAGLRAFEPFMKGERILELGAGSCNFTQKLLGRAKAVDTVEGSSRICNKLKTLNLQGLTVFDSLFEQFEPQHQYTDVIASFVNEHVIDTSVVYNLARKALLPGGHLFLIVPNRQAQSRQLALAMGLIPSLEALTSADIKNGHRRTYDLDSFRAEITTNNFSDVCDGGLLLKPFADFQLIKWLKEGQLDQTHLAGLEKLGRTEPRQTMALFAVTKPN